MYCFQQFLVFTNKTYNHMDIKSKPKTLKKQFFIDLQCFLLNKSHLFKTHYFLHAFLSLFFGLKHIFVNSVIEVCTMLPRGVLDRLLWRQVYAIADLFVGDLTSAVG